MTPSSPQAASRPLTPALALSAASWLAAGAAAGFTGAGLLEPLTGVPATGVLSAAGLVALYRAARPPIPAEQLTAEASGADRAVHTAAAIAPALAGLDHPDAALTSILRLVGGAADSHTVVLLTLTDRARSLRAEHPSLIAGTVPDRPLSMAVPVGAAGPIRLALAAGVPLAAGPPGDGAPGSWERIADAAGITAGAVVPIQIATGPVGILAVGGPDTGMTRAHLAALHRVAPAAGPAVTALLRLRTLTRRSVANARTARFRRDYASVVGHELRTPLTTILGVLSTLTRPGMAPENTDARDLLEMAVAQGDRLKRLVEDMLAINQVDGGGVAVHPELVALGDLIDRVVRRVPGAWDLTTVTVPAALPPVILDPEHTARVLGNLLANAVKYGDDSPIEVTVAVEDRTLVLTVADHGPGLPPGTASDAFDAFTQLKRTEVDAYGGIGLGLSVSQGLVAAMGGALRYRPTAGGGATFTVHLPFRPHAAAGA